MKKGDWPCSLCKTDVLNLSPSSPLPVCTSGGRGGEVIVNWSSHSDHFGISVEGANLKMRLFPVSATYTILL
jgi:hypothetical protein